MHMKEEARLLGKVEVEPLLKYVESLGEAVWHFKCDIIPTLRDCTRVILRHSRDYEFDLDDIVDWELMDDFRPYTDPIVAQMCGALGKSNISALFLARLPPGKDILPHVDRGEFLEVPSRVHVALKTNPGVIYRIGGMLTNEEDRMRAHKFAREFHFAPGEIWEIDNLSIHSVYNHGDTERWHLIANIW